jgi:hypothetical protein
VLRRARRPQSFGGCSTRSRCGLARGIIHQDPVAWVPSVQTPAWWCGPSESEWASYQPTADLLRDARRAFPPYPDSVLAQAPQIPFTFSDCRIWNVPKAPAAQRAVTRSSIPTLLLSGTFDAVTPPSAGSDRRPDAPQLHHRRHPRRRARRGNQVALRTTRARDLPHRPKHAEHRLRRSAQTADPTLRRGSPATPRTWLRDPAISRACLNSPSSLSHATLTSTMH